MLHVWIGFEGAHREYMSDTMSISASAWASFCSEEICGWRPKKYDILRACEVRVLVARLRADLVKAEA